MICAKKRERGSIQEGWIEKLSSASGELTVTVQSPDCGGDVALELFMMVVCVCCDCSWELGGRSKEEEMVVCNRGPFEDESWVEDSEVR